MFSSDNNNTYPLFYHQSLSLANSVIPESNYTLFQHYHGKPNCILPIQPTFSPIHDNCFAKLPSEPSIYQQNSVVYPSNIINHRTSSSRRAPGKKDRHTKISTAQGVRDRRVRLSMSIARDFFNLQDMLGFDKASKTIGWLMGKSKAAIDELNVTSNNKNEDTSVDGEKNALDAKTSSKKKRNGRDNKDINAMEMKRREEARNRARERTRNKKLGGDHVNQLQQDPSVQQDLMCFQSSSATSTTHNSTSSFGVISNGISSNDQEGCNYNNDYFNNSTSESCSYGGISALNIINLSKEFHTNDRPWDTYNNQFLR